MAIRLNKVLTELNIGLQTAVDFLKNNKSLGGLYLLAFRIKTSLRRDFSKFHSTHSQNNG